MLVFWKEKLVFLAMAKTGTTALEGALAPKATVVMRNPPILKHTPVYRYNRFLKPYFESCGMSDLATVAVIRHPISWLGSWYRYRARDEMKGKGNYTGDMSFDAFVDAYCQDDKPGFANVGIPSKFLRQNDGSLQIDHLFQYEEFELLVQFFEERLDTTIALKQRNVSPKMDLQLSPEVTAKLETTHADMFEIWTSAQRR